MRKIIKNGGIEQGFLSLANEDSILSKKDEERLKYLQSLPQNRVEQTYYYCTLCQKRHKVEEDIIYTKHITYQSKEGVRK